MVKHKASQPEATPLLYNNPPFAYAEAYKTLRTNLSFASISKQYKKIIITSAIPNEGKSTLAINLAITLGQSGARVILIDCDLRNPTLRRPLRIRSEVHEGLTSVLSGKSTLEECIQTHPRMNCDVLLVGAIPPNPVELLSSNQMKELLDRLSEHYDYIICDAPPVSVVTDAAALSQFCDGVILVVRQNVSTREQVWQAKRNLDAVQANILGTVLTCYDMDDDTQVVNTYYTNAYRYGYPGRTKRKKWYD